MPVSTSLHASVLSLSAAWTQPMTYPGLGGQTYQNMHERRGDHSTLWVEAGLPSAVD